MSAGELVGDVGCSAAFAKIAAVFAVSDGAMVSGLVVVVPRRAGSALFVSSARKMVGGTTSLSKSDRLSPNIFRSLSWALASSRFAERFVRSGVSSGLDIRLPSDGEAFGCAVAACPGPVNVLVGGSVALRAAVLSPIKPAISGPWQRRSAESSLLLRVVAAFR